jgi:hypothetical protein
VRCEPEFKIDPGQQQWPATATNLPLPHRYKVVSINTALFRPDETSRFLRFPRHESYWWLLETCPPAGKLVQYYILRWDPIPACISSQDDG